MATRTRTRFFQEMAPAQNNVKISNTKCRLKKLRMSGVRPKPVAGQVLERNLKTRKEASWLRMENQYDAIARNRTAFVAATVVAKKAIEVDAMRL